MNLTHATCAVTLAASVIAGGAASAAQAAEPVTPSAGVSGTVTLLTGDRVTVTANGHRIEPGPGRTDRFDVQRRQGHLHVIPQDAKRLLAKGLLDERLFDVTQLLSWGTATPTRRRFR
ncbi:hypothetical protein GCM10009850_102770 [Nonomuraea monospora]|uniref:Uncharacterized protein n=2 Tax=Nonomuraea monospora TaxID=568818 RepID=A0ABN3CZS1_9ACTN